MNVDEMYIYLYNDLIEHNVRLYNTCKKTIYKTIAEKVQTDFS